MKLQNLKLAKLFSWSPRFPGDDTVMSLLPISSLSNSANNLFKLFKVSFEKVFESIEKLIFNTQNY